MPTKISLLAASAAVTAPTAGTLLLVTHASTSGASTLGNLVKGSTAITTDNAGEINTATAKTAPVTADVLLIEDSAASYAKKKSTLGQLVKGSTAITTDNSGEINTATAKTSPVTADILLIEDSAATFAKKKITLGGMDGVVGPPSRRVVTTASTSITFANTMDGALHVCNTGSAVTVSVPTALTAGVTAEFMQATTNGTVTVTGATGVSIRYDAATWVNDTAAQWSSIVVTIIDTNEALIRGDLGLA